MGDFGRVVTLRLRPQSFSDLQQWSASLKDEDSRRLLLESGPHGFTFLYFQEAEVVSCLGAPVSNVPKALSNLASAGLITVELKALDSVQNTVKVLVELQPAFFSMEEKYTKNNIVYTYISTLFAYWVAEDQAAAVNTDAGPSTSAPAADKAPWTKSILRESVFNLVSPEDWHVESEQPEGLKSRLYRYQRRALAWMQWRESLASGATLQAPCQTLSQGASALAPCDTNSVKAQLPHTPIEEWHEVPMGWRDNSARVYYNPERREVRKEAPVFGIQKAASGGVLCDEMGLGKTVEVIALILSPSSKPYRPPSSSGVDGGPPQTEPSSGPIFGGTLVICPPALLQQWQAELSNHAGGSLNVVIYDGLRDAIDAAKAAEELERDDSDSSGDEVGGSRRGKGKGKAATQRKRRKKESVGARYDRYTTQMIREAEMYARVAAGENMPEEDERKFSIELAGKLAAADVVLTSFDVLTSEVYYDSSNNDRIMRRRKRYVIPDCPLVLVSWHRLVADEAQMVGRFSIAGFMCAKIESKHRWCVTGTPMTSKNELADLQALLSIIQCDPFDDPAVWNSLIERPLNNSSCSDNGADNGSSYSKAAVAWNLLAKTLRPLMWRTNKRMARSETDIPPRDLKVVPLKLMPGEHELYQQLVDEARETSAKVASKAAEVEEDAIAASAAAGRGGAAGSSSSAGKVSQAHRGRQNALTKLLSEQLRSLTELRLACIHPQLTHFWTTHMRGDMQIESGGTQSMEEVLQRLLDREAVQLQEAERELCAHLNGLAMLYLGTARGQTLATAPDGAGGSGSAGAGPSSPIAEGSPPGSPPVPGSAQQRRRSSATISADALAAAISLLEDSFRVSEKGIGALGVDLDLLESIPDPEGTQTSSWKTWKRVQINTLTQLVAAYERSSMPEEKINKYREQLTKRCGELEEAANQALVIAEQKVDSLMEIAQKALGSFFRTASGALTNGFPDEWGDLVLSCAERWHIDLCQNVHRATFLNGAEGSSILNGAAHQIYAEEEKKVQGDQNRLEAWVVTEKTKAAVAALQRELARLDGASDAGDIHRDLRMRMKDWVDLLPRFRRDTILNTHARVLPIPRSMPKYEGQGALIGDALIDKDGYEIREALFEDSVEYNTATIDALLLHAAELGNDFIASSQFKGCLPGYVFKMGDAGRLGYFKDCPPVVDGEGETEQRKRENLPLVAQIQECGVALVRALNELRSRSQRQIRAEDLAVFNSCGIDAVQKRLDCSLRQAELIKAGRELHKARQAVVAKQALKDEAYEEAQSAKTECPIRVAGRSREVLRRVIDDLKVNAQHLRAKRTFMANRITETINIPENLANPEFIASGSGCGHMHQAAADAEGADRADGAPEGASPDTISLPGPQLLEDRRPGMGCPVCLNDIVGDIWLWTGCGHAYCVDCSHTLQSMGAPQCAVCRTKTARNQIIRIAAQKPHRLQSSAQACDPTAEDDPVVKAITLTGEWSIKINALLRRIQAIAATSPEEKCLVFSQFPAALRTLRRALQSESIGFEELSGGKEGMRKAMQGFLGDDSKRVFLLSLQAGAQGLTLVRANHVFLLEPALDPAIEQQAIARVHRIGQMRPVHVVRMLVNGTIEEEVLAIQRSRQALFYEEERENGAAEMEMEDEEDAEAATTVATRVQNEVVGEEDVGRLLNAVLMG